MRTHSRQQGFTLLELMVALAILAIGIVALMQAVSQGVSASSQIHDLTTATTLAQMKMEEIASSVSTAPSQSNGDFGEQAPGFAWRAAVEDTDIEGLKKVTVTVLWQRGRKTHTTTLETCVAEDLQVTPLEETGLSEQAPVTSNQPSGTSRQ